MQPKYQIFLKVPAFVIKNVTSYYVAPGYVISGYVKDY